jgi:TonB family protein
MKTVPMLTPVTRACARALVPRAMILILAAVPALAAAGKAAIKPTFNAYFPADFKDAAYQQAAVSRVSKNWMVPGGHLPAKGSKTVVQAVIARDGKLGAAVVTMKSGSKEWDDAALAAVTKGAPFAPLPGGYPQAKIEVHWHFSAN